MSKPIGLQLYSVRHPLAADFEGTIAKVAAMGYDAVEFFGGFSLPAERITAALRSNGLVCCGWHTGWEALQPDTIYATIAYFQAVGCDSVVIPGFPGECYQSLEAWKAVVAKLGGIAKILKGYGMTLGYHNHDSEWNDFGGETLFDAFMAGTCPCVNWQFDIGNGLSSHKADPVALLERYPERIHNIHCKPWSEAKGYDCVIGEDDVDWAKVAALAEANPATMYYIVEYEQEDDPIAGCRTCIENLKKVL